MLQQRHEHTRGTNRKIKVYIYRSTSLMLTSLCVSFQESFVDTFQPVVLEAPQAPGSVHVEEKLYDELLRCSGGEV